MTGLFAPGTVIVPVIPPLTVTGLAVSSSAAFAIPASRAAFAIPPSTFGSALKGPFRDCAGATTVKELELDALGPAVSLHLPASKVRLTAPVVNCPVR